MRKSAGRKIVPILIAAMIILICPPGFAGTTGVISGVITDASTGEKLSGVNIIVKGTNLTTVTDANGYFVITNVAPGSYEIIASLVGYDEGAIGDVQVTMDATSTVNVSLNKTTITEKEAVVTGTRTLLQPDVTNPLYMVTSRQEKMTKTQPNATYQIQSLAGTQPGVVLDSEGLPHIRGGRAEEIGYMIEGIPVMEPLTNMFGTNTVTVGMSRMQVYTGGYPAEFGNAISGVLNEIKRTGSEVGGPRLEMSDGAESYGGLYGEFGGVSPSGLDYYVGTYAWKSQFERMFFRGVDSIDNVGKFVLPKGKDKWTLLVNQGYARYYLDSVHDFTYLYKPVTPEEDHNHQSYNIVGLTFSRNFTPASFLTIRPYLFNTSNIVDATSPDGPMGMYLDYGTRQRGLQVEYVNQVNENHLIKTGASICASKNSYLAWVPGLGEWIGFPEWGDYWYTSRVNTVQTGAFIQDQIKMGDLWHLDLGVRFDGMRFNKVENPDVTQSQISPRLGITRKLGDKTLVKASWGKFIQFPPSYVMERIYFNPGWEEYRPGNQNLKPERSVSWDFSVEQQIGDNAILRVTPFYRTYKDLIQSQKLNPDDPESFTSIFVNSGKGKSTGVECYYSRKLSKNWEGWVSYTWMKARANASSFQSAIDPSVWVYTDWDQRHTLNAVLTYRQKSWEHNFQITYGSGLADTVDLDTASTQKHAPGALVFSYNLTKKLPKNSPIGESVSLNIWNIFNVGKPTHFYQYWYPDDPEDPDSSWSLIREADAWTQPRFISISVQKRF